MTDLDRLADHYAAMARLPWAVDYARQRVKEMMREDTGIFKELGKMVKERLERE